jgi:hypothetical protein
MRMGSSRAAPNVLLLLACLLPVLAGFACAPAAARPALRTTTSLQLAKAAVMAEPEAEEEAAAAGADDETDAVIDALVRAEVEACFAGLEEALATGDEKAALALIESQGKQVLGNVLTQLEEDGQLLSSQISAKVEALATDRRVEMLKAYDSQCAARARADRDRLPRERAQEEGLTRQRAVASPCAGWPACRRVWQRTARPSGKRWSRSTS